MDVLCSHNNEILKMDWAKLLIHFNFSCFQINCNCKIVIILNTGKKNNFILISNYSWEWGLSWYVVNLPGTTSIK